jgi:hypothetical protein
VHGEWSPGGGERTAIAAHGRLELRRPRLPTRERSLCGVTTHIDCSHSALAGEWRSSTLLGHTPVEADRPLRSEELNRSRGKKHSDPATVDCRWVVET